MKIIPTNFFNCQRTANNNKYGNQSHKVKELSQDTFCPSFGSIPFSTKFGISEEFYKLVDNTPISQLSEFIKNLEKESEKLKGIQKELKEAQINFAKIVKADYDRIIAMPDSKIDGYNPMDYLIDGNDY